MSRMSQLHTAVYRRSGGRLLTHVGHQPVLLLTTLGHRSHEPRTTPLQYLRRGDSYVVVAADHGAPVAPSWARNAIAEPNVAVQVGPDRIPLQARLALGRERTELFHELCAANRLLPSVQSKAERQLDVFVLEPRPLALVAQPGARAARSSGPESRPSATVQVQR